MKKIVVLCACLIFIIVSPIAAAELEKKPIDKTGQTQAIGAKVEVKGMTQAPNRVGATEKVSINTGHKHDGEGTEDLRPNPLKAGPAGPEAKGMTQAPNHVNARDKALSTGHKHDGQGSEDLHPNPLKTGPAESVGTVMPIPGNTPAQ